MIWFTCAVKSLKRRAALKTLEIEKQDTWNCGIRKSRTANILQCIEVNKILIVDYYIITFTSCLELFNIAPFLYGRWSRCVSSTHTLSYQGVRVRLFDTGHEPERGKEKACWKADSPITFPLWGHVSPSLPLTSPWHAMQSEWHDIKALPHQDWKAYILFSFFFFACKQSIIWQVHIMNNARLVRI